MSRKPRRVCKETADALTLGAADELQLSRAEFHLRRCPACRAGQQTVEAARRAVLSADDSLDDVTRARVQARLAEAMEDAASQGARRSVKPWARPGRLVALAAALLVGVTAAALWWTASDPADPRPTSPPAELAARKVLRPVAIVAGSAPWGDSRLRLDQRVSRLRLPDGVALRVELTLGHQATAASHKNTMLSNTYNKEALAELTLFGPLDLGVVQARQRRVVLRLDSGILLGQFAGGAGRTLSVRSPGVTTEIVGTFFAVEAQVGQSRISVARGQVEVRPAGGGAPVRVAAQESWSTARPSLTRTPAPVAALLMRHDRRDEAATAPATTAAGPGRAREPALVTPLAPAAPAGVRMRARRPAARRAPGPGVAQPPVPPAPGPIAEAPPAEALKKERKPPQPGRAAALYRDAEAALGRGDRRAARRVLEAIIKGHPADPLTDAARYDLALLLLREGQGAQAAAVLHKIAAGSRFAGPAHFLRCDILGTRGERTQAAACYRDHRERFPDSPHDQRALQALIRLSMADGGCARARGLIGDYLTLYPNGTFSAEARRLERACRR